MSNALFVRILGGLIIGVSGSAQAQEISSNVTLATDYIFRGVTQTDHSPAIQGGFDVTGSSFYAGSWASNVDFNDGTNIELDLYAGITPTFGEFTFDLGGIFYAYPGSPDDAGEQDFVEVFAGVSRDFGALSWDVKLSYSSDFYLETGPAWYREIGVALPLSDTLSLDGRYGRSTFDDIPSADYEDYQLGLTLSALDLDWDLRWYDSAITDSRVVFSISRSFGG